MLYCIFVELYVAQAWLSLYSILCYHMNTFLYCCNLHCISGQTGQQLKWTGSVWKGGGHQDWSVLRAPVSLNPPLLIKVYVPQLLLPTLSLLTTAQPASKGFHTPQIPSLVSNIPSHPSISDSQTLHGGTINLHGGRSHARPSLLYPRLQFKSLRPIRGPILTPESQIQCIIFLCSIFISPPSSLSVALESLLYTLRTATVYNGNYARAIHYI